MAVQHVSGRNVGHIMLYALSTCPWCKKTKKLLEDLRVEYYYEDVDFLGGDEREAITDTIKRWNPSCSFPTLVLNNNKCIVGFRENEIRDTLKL